MLLFLPPEIIEKPVVFLCFQGKYKENIGRQYIKSILVRAVLLLDSLPCYITGSLRQIQTFNLLNLLIVDFVDEYVQYCTFKLVVKQGPF